MTMTRRQFGVLTAGAALAVSDERTSAMAAISDDLRGKVEAVVSGWEAAWNAANMDAMWQLATDDVHWVNVVGMHWRGKAEVQQAHQTYFDMMFKNRTAKLDEIESVEVLPGGAVVAVVRWSFGGFRQPDGAMRPPGKDRMSLVMAPRGNRLAIVHGANVHIDEDAAKFDPIKH
jgi:uncharacterized protein (TIGR02246 family)